MDRRDYGSSEVWWSEIHPSGDKVKVKLEECDMDHAEDPCGACMVDTAFDDSRHECEGVKWYDCVWVVCDLCSGRGFYVNPSIDEHGITREEFDSDPEFQENYQRGMFNVKCTKCKGRTTIPEIVSIVHTVWILKQIHQIGDSVIEEIAERRMGA